MLKMLFAFFMAFASAVSTAQSKLSDGNYVTSDGFYTITLEFKKDSLVVIEPNRRSVYKKIAEKEFSFIHPQNGIDYRIQILDSNKIATFKPATRASQTILGFVGKKEELIEEDNIQYLEIASKYLQKAQEEPDNVQVWSFCSGVASARATYNNDGFRNYAVQAIKNLKLIIVDKSKCPCEDAIPKDLWDSIE